MTTAIPLPADADLPEAIRARLAQLPPLNVFRMLANVPQSFQPLLDFVASLLIGGRFDPRKREIGILRVAHLTRSTYEWTQHAQLGRNLGLTEAEIGAIATDGAVRGLDEEGNFLCRVADEITREIRLSDEALAQCVARYGVQQATEVILCVSYFNMLSRFLESTRVPLESENVLGTRTPADLARRANDTSSRQT